MRRIILKFICLFIPSKKLRKKIRAKFRSVSKPILLINVFKTNYKNNVLISYITQPFKQIALSHSCMTECYTAAKVFKNLEFNVDVVDFNSDIEIDYIKYDAVYGFGNTFEKSFNSKNSNIKRIMYGTGCSVSFSNPESAKRVYAFNKKYRTNAITSGRFATFFPKQHYFSDLIISLGNEFPKNTYQVDDINLSINSLDLFYFDEVNRNIKQKDFELAKKHFLWFGSSGLIHKGLDLTIEYFQKNPHLTLHICGANPNEKEFFNVFKDELENRVPNIINHGFVKIDGDDFENVIRTCGFVVFPTVSEGGAASLLNTMVNGVIPITTKACSLDINDTLGFIIEELSYKGIDKQVRKALSLSDKQLENLSKKVREDTKKRYTLEKYKHNLEKLIRNSLDKK